MGVAFNLADLFEGAVDAYPDREYLVVEGDRRTYGEMEARANRLAHHLAGEGVGAGDHVGIYAYNSAQWVEAIWAVFKLRAVWTDAYEGPPGCLHGGFVAAAFDDLMGVAQMASGNAGFTGTLTVRMRRPTPLHERIDYEAGVEKAEGRKITVWGKSWAGDTLLADATILFIAPKGGVLGVR